MATTNYIWDETNDTVLQEKDETGATTARYTNKPELYGKTLSQERGTEKRYFHYDGRGSTRALTDENQNVTDTFGYTAFGEEVERTGTTFTPYHFQGAYGYQNQTEKSELYIRNRNYSCELGRWTSRDPIAFYGDTNLYRAGFIPYEADPSGLVPMSCECRCGHPRFHHKRTVEIECTSWDCCINACAEIELRGSHARFGCKSPSNVTSTDPFEGLLDHLKHECDRRQPTPELVEACKLQAPPLVESLYVAWIKIMEHGKPEILDFMGSICQECEENVSLHIRKNSLLSYRTRGRNLGIDLGFWKPGAHTWGEILMFVPCQPETATVDGAHVRFTSKSFDWAVAQIDVWRDYKRSWRPGGTGFGNVHNWD